ncbi:13829_t:CDS:1, partial [Funneliformis geosporum]
LSIERMEAMAKLHTYYVTNTTTEMNYSHSHLSEEELYKTFNESLNFTEFSDETHEQKEEFDFIDDNNEDFAEENETEIPNKNNEIIIENYFDFNNQEF